MLDQQHDGLWGFGRSAVVALVALRLAVGWHFFSDGAKKFRDPDFRSANFLAQAVGPLADDFQSLIPDPYGTRRLDRTAVLGAWDAFEQQLLNGADEEAAKSVESAFEDARTELDYFYAEHADQLTSHRNDVERLRGAKADPSLRDVEFQRAWIKSEDGRLRYAYRPWTSELQQLSLELQHTVLAQVANAVPPPAFAELVAGDRKNWVDHTVSWLVLGVGCLLLLGLFTRLASFVGAAFLASCMATQPFWVVGAETGYAPYQLIEFTALILLAATAAGRFAGLDFFTAVRRIRQRAERQLS